MQCMCIQSVRIATRIYGNNSHSTGGFAHAKWPPSLCSLLDVGQLRQKKLQKRCNRLPAMPYAIERQSPSYVSECDIGRSTSTVRPVPRSVFSDLVSSSFCCPFGTIWVFCVRFYDLVYCCISTLVLTGSCLVLSS